MPKAEFGCVRGRSRKSSTELAASLVGSSFCGLPRQEKRMAVFVSASDESDGGHHRSTFWHGGWIAPETDWSTYFASAWQERVLDAEPKIPFLHITDIRDPDWRKEHGMTWDQAQDRMDEAALVINHMGSLYPITTNTNAGAFLDAHGKKKFMESVSGKKAARYLVDHFSFNAYVLTVLHYINLNHPESEKVDFVVERKEGVFEKLKQFYDTFESGLKHIGRPELAKYLGELIPAGKERVPVQAADILCWHASRHDLGLLKGRDAMRATVMFNRKGKIIPLTDELHAKLARAFTEKLNELEKLNEKELRVRELRPHHAQTNQGATQRDKGRSGRRKGGNTKKAEG
jgi:hypothetical protein